VQAEKDVAGARGRRRGRGECRGGSRAVVSVGALETGIRLFNISLDRPLNATIASSITRWEKGQ
jgi:hypothetical protein